MSAALLLFPAGHPPSLCSCIFTVQHTTRIHTTTHTCSTSCTTFFFFYFFTTSLLYSATLLPYLRLLQKSFIFFVICQKQLNNACEIQRDYKGEEWNSSGVFLLSNRCCMGSNSWPWEHISVKGCYRFREEVEVRKWKQNQKFTQLHLSLLLCTSAWCPPVI